MLVSGEKSLQNMLRDVALIVAEAKLNYGRKWADLPAWVSDKFERLVEAYGSTLFLEVLKEMGK